MVGVSHELGVLRQIGELDWKSAVISPGALGRGGPGVAGQGGEVAEGVVAGEDEGDVFAAGEEELV